MKRVGEALILFLILSRQPTSNQVILILLNEQTTTGFLKNIVAVWIASTLSPLINGVNPFRKASFLLSKLKYRWLNEKLPGIFRGAYVMLHYPHPQIFFFLIFPLRSCIQQLAILYTSFSISVSLACFWIFLTILTVKYLEIIFTATLKKGGCSTESWLKAPAVPMSLSSVW